MYYVIMERFFGLEEVIGSYKDIAQARQAVQIKMQAMLLVDPKANILFRIQKGH